MLLTKSTNRLEYANDRSYSQSSSLDSCRTTAVNSFMSVRPLMNGDRGTHMGAFGHSVHIARYLR